MFMKSASRGEHGTIEGFIVNQRISKNKVQLKNYRIQCLTQAKPSLRLSYFSMCFNAQLFYQNMLETEALNFHEGCMRQIVSFTTVCRGVSCTYSQLYQNGTMEFANVHNRLGKSILLQISHAFADFRWLFGKTHFLLLYDGLRNLKCISTFSCFKNLFLHKKSHERC